MTIKQNAVLGLVGLGMVAALAACGGEPNSQEQSAENAAEAPPPQASFDIAGHSHEVRIRCFVGSDQMNVSPEDSTGETQALPAGMSSLSVSADFTQTRNQVVVIAMSDSDDPRHLYQWVVRDGDQPLGEFRSLEIDRQNRTAEVEAVFHNNAYDSDDALFERGEERQGTVRIRCP